MARNGNNTTRVAAAALVALLAGATSAVATQPEKPPTPEDPEVVAQELVAVLVAPARLAKLEERAARLSLRAAEAAQLERALEIELERVDIAELVEDPDWLDVQVVTSWDRVPDIPHPATWAPEWHDADSRGERHAQGFGAMAADFIVGAARLPARAGLVIKHLATAFAKVTPRVARALF